MYAACSFEITLINRFHRKTFLSFGRKSFDEMRRNQLKGRRTEKTKLIVYSAHLAGKSKGA